jgi:hypothetical protein
LLVNFGPPPLDAKCIQQAVVTFTYRGPSPSDVIAAYPARPEYIGLQPGDTKDALVLLDNRPRGDFTFAATTASADVTEIAKLFASGGPFPSHQRRIATGSPIFLSIQSTSSPSTAQVLASVDPPPSLVLRTSCSS